MTRPTRVLFVCTGNATRSLIAARLLEAARPGWSVRSRGTMVYEGLPPSRRTLAALQAVGVGAEGHTGRQLRGTDLDDVDLVVTFEQHHVAYVRRHHPDAAPRTATLLRLVRDLPGGPGRLADRVASLDLAAVPLEAWEEVDDPAGGDAATFVACAERIAELMERLVPRLDDVRVSG